MQIIFKDKELENLYTGNRCGNKLYAKLSKNKTFMKDFVKVMDILYSAKIVTDLSVYGSLHYERLKYELNGISSVRIGFKSKYRLLFTESENKIEVTLIEINEHYGDK